MRILVSTYGEGDADKVLDAMRALPYDRLVLLGEQGTESSQDLKRISKVEAYSGQEVRFIATPGNGFLELVDEVAEALSGLSRDDEGRRSDIFLNVSGGPKMLGNAAIFAAFRLGIRAYHCDGKAVRLPVLTGATSMDRFTAGQLRLVEVLATPKTLSQATELMEPVRRQGVERLVRELRRTGLLESSVKGGTVTIGLTPAGREVLRAVTLSRH